MKNSGVEEGRTLRLMRRMRRGSRKNKKKANQKKRSNKQEERSGKVEKKDTGSGGTELRGGRNTDGSLRGASKWEQIAKVSKEEWGWQRGITSYTRSDGSLQQSHLTGQRWESEKHKKAGDGQSKAFATTSPRMALSLEHQASGERVGGLWCSLTEGRMRGMCGTLGAELEEQRSIKRAELMAFRRLLSLVVDPQITLWITDGLWRGEAKCIGPTAKDAELWNLIWEGYGSLAGGEQRGPTRIDAATGPRGRKPDGVRQRIGKR